MVSNSLDALRRLPNGLQVLCQIGEIAVRIHIKKVKTIS